MGSLRIFVADHDEVIRQQLTAFISQQPGWEVCGEAATGDETVKQVAQLKPDVILLHFGLTDPSGFEAAREIVKNDSSQKIIALAVSDGVSAAQAAFDAGALGYILKANASRDVIAAIKALQEGRTYFTARIAETILQTCVPMGKTEQLRPLRSERDRMALKFLAREAALGLGSHPRRRTIPPSLRYAFYAGALVMIVILGWTYYGNTFEEQFPFIDKTLVQIGLKTAPPAVYQGNPDAKVWIDLRTALYYCPGTVLYGKTGKGKFAKQHEALSEHFEPATRKACD